VEDASPTAALSSPFSTAPLVTLNQSPVPQGARGTITPIAVVSNPGLYNIVVPTPSAPALIYPIQFDSNLSIVTYPVTGTTLVALSRSLDTNALPDPHEKNSRYYARTDWYLSGHWNWNPAGQGCEVDKGSVSIAMTMTLPLLSSTVDVPVDVISRWNTFVNNTVIHETGHVQLDLQGARDYQRKLGNFPPALDCDAIQSKLRTLFDDSFANIDRANTGYDSTTRHGRTQGAVFP
jgi:predicted secreted Zn-dependent protease